MQKKGFLLALIALFLGWSQHIKPARDPAPEEKKELIAYLKSNWKTPEDYILNKFADYDIITIGEHHQIKHDVRLIQDLIPLLHKAGVYDLGIECGCSEYQSKVDSLLIAETYDENLARWLMFKWGSYWPYQEYQDIYRKAWEFNRSLPPGAPKFRVIHLDYRVNWPLVRENMTSELRSRVFTKGDRDDHMFQVIVDEFINKKKKALIYVGQVHASTRFCDPVYDFNKGKNLGFNEKRMGHLVFRLIPERVFNICLHFPWPSKRSAKGYGYPAAGVIDEIMREFKDKRVGFDIKNSPFGSLRDDRTLYSAGRNDFKLSDFCDGYVFLKHFKDYEGCTLDPEFITAENFKETIDYLPNPRLRRMIKNRPQLINYLKTKAEFKNKYPDLE